MKPIRRKDNRLWARIIYFLNDLYNATYIFLSNQSLKSSKCDSDFIAVKREILDGANPTQTTWLLNIDRSIKIIKLITGLTEKQISHSVHVQMS